MSGFEADNNGVSISVAADHKTVADFEVSKKPKRNKFAFACSILASLASILLGYDIGVMSGAILYIKDDLKISDVQVEILVGILNLYCLIGAYVAGRTSDWIGRRYTIVVAAAIFFVGALLMGFATNYRNWRRLCLIDCSGVHRRSISSFCSWLSQLIP
ncbi:hypothetical protein PVK06_000112 [Gossypium arboreum]|uniref:Major facilitator superfamily (MFS) profile domain-containing protein n=1 Tax=Gossypium arboreum TaxID=29729 RepID=A0ABR0QYH9_GOSAR|nr:hypothetical protein PVK06_000112 [Gossypium arboreum]